VPPVPQQPAGQLASTPPLRMALTIGDSAQMMLRNTLPDMSTAADAAASNCTVIHAQHVHACCIWVRRRAMLIRHAMSPFRQHEVCCVLS